jgi:hypothetical protein
MPQVIAKLRKAGSETEAEAFLRETRAFPIMFVALGGLALGDVAIALTMLVNSGLSH